MTRRTKAAASMVRRAARPPPIIAAPRFICCRTTPVLIPSATIAQGYDTLNVTTKDGETYSGVRVGSSNNPLRLRLASGTEMVLHPNQIERIDRSKVSLMPEGLLNNLTHDETRDLFTFLAHLK